MSTPIGPSSNPMATPASLRLAQSYGVAPTMTVRPVAGPPAAERTQGVDQVRDTMRIPLAVEAKASGPVSRLVAAAVPGSVDFSGDTPKPSTDGMPLYRHPADRNAAATGVQAGRVVVGRTLDTQG